jgi:hypothetical protein
LLAILDDGKYVGTYLCTVLHFIGCFMYVYCTPNPPKPQVSTVCVCCTLLDMGHTARCANLSSSIQEAPGGVLCIRSPGVAPSAIHEAPSGVLCIRSPGEAPSAIHEAPGGVLCIQSSGDGFSRGTHRAARQGVRQFIREMRLSFIEFGTH